MANGQDTELYRILYSPAAVKMLKTIPIDHRRTIIRRIRQLEKKPEQQGKPLRYDLQGFRSIHVIRYRVIYNIDSGKVIIYIVAVGIRKKGDRDDIYELAKKIIKKGFLD